MTAYFRPILTADPACPDGALWLAGGPLWFDKVECLSRTRAPRIVPATDLPMQVRDRLTAPRPAVAGLDMVHPQVMGILNVTPDSFSDGGVHNDLDRAVAHAKAMVAQGADLLDIGGESTRPGAETVPDAQEIARTAPVIEALTAQLKVPISIDTRKSAVARAAVQAGAQIVNDVAGFTYDPDLAGFCAGEGLPVCVMHAQGDPATMQADPTYDDVLLDVYDFLATQVEMLEAKGLTRGQILVDPGIGFGKTLAHNLALLNRISLFHALGCPILLGVSRKRFIGTLSGVDTAAERVHGSVSVALYGAAQGVQVLRVHDVAETRQALTLWQAVQHGSSGFATS